MWFSGQRRRDQKVLKNCKVKKMENILLAPCPCVSSPGERATPALILRALGNLSESRIFGERPDKMFTALMLPKFPHPKVVLAFRLARQLLEIFHSVWTRNLPKPARGEDLVLLSSKMILS